MVNNVNRNLRGGELMSFIVDILEHLLSNKKSLVYSAFGQKDYYRVIDKLQNSRVPYRTRIDRNMSSRHTYNDNFTQYDIFVKEEDVGKAQKAIHK